MTRKKPKKLLPKQPNAPLREAFERSGLTLNEICLRMGWVRKDRTGRRYGDTTRLSRALGMKPHTSGRKAGVPYVYKEPVDLVPHATALLILDALDLDPIDVGL